MKCLRNFQIDELKRINFLHQGTGISAKCRNAKVEDLWSLTSFFGYSTQTFVLAVNLLDRFLAMMKVHMHALLYKPCSDIQLLLL